jgi:ABC-type multidrug transport system fused ATPase/permease subunit
MKTSIKHNFLGYFNFFYKVLGIKFVVTLFLSIGVSFLDGIGLAMFIPLLQSMSENGQPNQDQSQSLGKLNFLTEIFHKVNLPLNIYTVLAMLITLFLLKGMLKFVELYSQVGLKQTFIRTIRYQLTDDLQNLSYKGFLDQNAGKIQNTVTTEVQKLQASLTHYLNSTSSVGMLLTYVAMAFLANWQFALLVAVGALITNLFFGRMVKSVKTASFKISSKGDIFTAYLIEAVHYFKYLKATNQFQGFSRKIKTVIDDTENLNRKLGHFQAITASIREPIVMIIVVVVIIIQIRWMGGNLGSILLSLLLFYRALSFLMNFQNSWQNFVQNVGAIDSVTRLSNDMKAHKEIQNDKIFTGFNSSLEIKDLTFKYGEQTVINRVNMQIPKNYTIAFVGESGSGKTTLANIITGILQPESGHISLDGVKVTDYNLDSFRSCIGYISQEPVIFKDDVYNNVTFWAERTPENLSRFWEVIELASLTDFIKQMPEKELTGLGDKGMLISGGQKQRISIARELYKKAEILILDEATSALDSETELYIQRNIDKLQGNYTLIIIAHRLSTIKKADQIYILENGKISHNGTFDELTEKSSKFARMVSLQQI